MSHGHSLKEFREYRERMNEKALSQGNLLTKRFFNIDTQVYEDGALPRKTKELLGLVSSLVLRCDDCVTYHVTKCVEEKVSDREFFEAFNVGLVVGGSIVIPHLRHAVEILEECRKKKSGHPRRGKPLRIRNGQKPVPQKNSRGLPRKL